MTFDDFVSALEQELRLRGVAFARRDLRTFAEDVWPLAAEDPDVTRWALAFLDRGQVEQRA
jgi:hypothetical protein